MDSFKQGKNSETSSEEIDQPEKLVNDDNTGTGRSYECTFCKRGFTNAQALGGHMNIHRKDKAKLAKSKQTELSPSVSNKPSRDQYMASNYFAPILSDQKPYYQGFGSQINYQTLVPTPNPNLSSANSEFMGLERGSINANLSLGIGVPYMEENEEKKRGGIIDINMGDEVDLELRLGHNP